MRKISIIFAMLYYSVYGFSQSISVSSFKLLETDLTANTTGTMEQDQNGEIAALIKVVTTQTGFTFDGGSLGIVKTIQKPSEIWVYVPRGLKKISISHPQLGMLRDYFINIPIEAARTYEMVLVTGEVHTIIKQKSNSQYLVVKVTPPEAVVELNNEILPTSNGIAQKFVKLGTYDYRIQAQDYHTAAGKVTVDDPNNKKVLEVNLKPAFGWIEIPNHKDYNGAQVFIDNILVGTIPMKSRNLSSGEHNIKIVKELYHPYSENVVVKDNETTQIAPKLSANYSEVTISVDNGADIYVNEEKKGSGSWTGKLASGSYILEAKKDNHRSTSQSIDISSAQPKNNIKLIAPDPICGELNITSTPNLADVFIDGKMVGQTPIFIPEILVGKHSIKLRLNDYEDFSQDIIVSDRDNKIIDAHLILLSGEIKRINISTDKNFDVSLYVDNEYYGIIRKGKTLEINVKSGRRLFEIKADYNHGKGEWNFHSQKIITITRSGQNVLFVSKNGEDD